MLNKSRPFLPVFSTGVKLSAADPMFVPSFKQWCINYKLPKGLAHIVRYPFLKYFSPCKIN